MTSGMDPIRFRQEQIASRLRRLREIEAGAAAGVKLHNTTDRICAALHLTRAWHEAKGQGLAKPQFEQKVLDSLSHAHGGRTEFRLNRYTLKQSEVARLSAKQITPRDVAIYASLREPQKSLDAYLAGLRVAARHCNADPDEWAIEMLSQTSLWLAPTAATPFRGAAEDAEASVNEEADIPAETLAVLLDRLARHLAVTNKLAQTVTGLHELPCRWEMFDERIVPSSSHPIDRDLARSSPVGRAVYFEEMTPFPSVPLIRLPLVSHSATLGLMEVGPMKSSEMSKEEAFLAFAFASGVRPIKGRMPTVGLPTGDDIERIESRVTLFREIRLAIAPVDRHSWGAVLEFRPFLCVDLPGNEGEIVQHYVRNAIDPDLARPHFYPLVEDDRLVWPVVERNGVVRRVGCLAVHDDTLDDPDDLANLWAKDILSPVASPMGPLEPWYLTYAAATAAELRHWVASADEFRSEPFASPWQRDDYPAEVYGADLPPQREFYFPSGGAATDIEACLYNGLIEQALQVAIDRLTSSAAEVRSSVSSAREANAQRLLTRWRDPAP